MIDPKELRIGNYINEYGKPLKVTRIEISDPPYIGIYHEPNSIGATHGSVLDPIPLTPEIITDWCGFEEIAGIFRTTYRKKIQDKTYLEISWHNSEFTNKMWGFFEQDYDDLPTPFWKPIQSLHTLQNIWYVITSEELEIKIPSQAP